MVFHLFKSGISKVKKALVKTGSLFGNKVRTLFKSKIDSNTLEELEEILYEADLGVKLATELTRRIKDTYAANPKLNGGELLEHLKQEMIESIKPALSQIKDLPKSEGPLVIMVVGVNGNGKTTSVAKLAKKFVDEGQKVLVAAADTFRAAASDQLEIWANRIGIEIVKGVHNSDPAAVTFDAMSAGKARGMDVVLIDTAGRLHTKLDLMQELEKIKRSCRKFSPSSPHETLLVLDATTGQNAIDQATVFNKYTPISGLILTKLDGTAKGGIALNIQRQLGIPIKFIGVGESMDDLEPFDAETFINALFE